MPNAILHILVPLVLMAFVKDWYEAKKGKRTFPLRYVLIAGLAGLIPDLDVVAFWFLHFFGFTYEQVHKTYMHTLFVPLIFLFLYFLFAKIPIIETRSSRMKAHIIFLMLAFGSFFHLLLDATLGPAIAIFYPLSTLSFGIFLASYLPNPLDSLLIPSLETALLVLWLIYLEWKHKISDFI